MSEYGRQQFERRRRVLACLISIHDAAQANGARLVETNADGEVWTDASGRRWLVNLGPGRDRDGEPERQATPLDREVRR